ncbi:MAG: pilus assembly protein PilM [Dehalococcoidales bacterium]|nr:pilus assembly protein PilM [Dehalococcoidales bacterium]
MRNIIRQIRQKLSPPVRVVTIEINSTSLRLMETSGTRVTKWASQILEPGLFENEVVTNPRVLSIAIRQLMVSNGIKAKKISASVSGLYSLSRIISVPASPTGGPVTQEAVLKKAHEVLPISEDELYISWQTIATVDGGHHVLVVGVPKEMIDGEVKALRAAGMSLRILGLKAMALIRAVNREQALILNIEPTTIDIILVADGIAQSIHTTGWKPANMSIEDMAEHLAVALDLTAGSYNSTHPGASLDTGTPLFIIGEMSGDLELVAGVQVRVAYPLKSLSPSLEFPPNLPVSQYAVNIGLASREIVRKPGDGGPIPLTINLLPQIYRPWRPTARQIYLFSAIVAIIALLYPAYNLITDVSSKTTNLRTRYDLANNELNRRKAEIARREPLQKSIEAYQTIVDRGGGFIEDMQVITDKAEEFGIEVPTITHSGSSISMSAGADNYTAFRDYTAALQQSGRFTSVTRPSERYPYIENGLITLIPKTK